MTVAWDEVAARARGLATRLAGPGELARLAASESLEGLARALGEGGHAEHREHRATAPAALEGAIRRAAARRVTILERWLGAREPLFAVALGDADRRSLRDLVRGAVAGLPPEQRIAAALPTRALPERVLLELARSRDVAELASRVAAERHPLAPALSGAGADTHKVNLNAGEPALDLYALELALDRAWAGRALALARRGGDELEAVTRDAIDVENAASAVLLATRAAEVALDSAFLDGGRRLARERFRDAVASGSAGTAAEALATAFAGSAVANALHRHGSAPARLERALAGARLADLRRAARRQPLGPLPALAFLLAQRLEVEDLQRLVWTVALGAPAALRLPPQATSAEAP